MLNSNLLVNSSPALLTQIQARKKYCHLYQRSISWAVVAVSLVLIAHNFCVSVLPQIPVPLDPATMRAVEGTRNAYTVSFSTNPGDTLLNPRSRLVLTEDGVPLILKQRLPDVVFRDGLGAWSHSPDRIFFSSSDNTDPRTNGRHYVAHAPILYSRCVGYGAIAALVSAVWCIRRLRATHVSSSMVSANCATPVPKSFHIHVAAAATIFLAGLYCSTGTLAPYANTLFPRPDPATGFLYNIDHATHRTVFDFVDAAPRSTWQNSLLLRRILHAVLAWPFMKVFGFETGGVFFNLAINLAGFFAGVTMVRRHIGISGAIFAGWLLAVYPGAAYWVGQPYSYALIFPLSIVAFWILVALPTSSPIRITLLSLCLGAIYLSYDFHAYFLPASLLVLTWHRRYSAAVASGILQIIPISLWLWILQHVVRVPLENVNTEIYSRLLASFFDPTAFSTLLPRLAALPEIAADIFFGANFLFLPLLAVVAWTLDFSWKQFTRQRAVVALLASGVALFLFCHLPPPHEGPWNTSGSWIARIYQPIFPALVFSLAWWWQELRPTARAARRLRTSLVVAAFTANAAICFGPIARLPSNLAPTAYYRFYDHNELHWLHDYNLLTYGRRPLGFPEPIHTPLSKP